MDLKLPGEKNQTGSSPSDKSNTANSPISLPVSRKVECNLPCPPNGTFILPLTPDLPEEGPVAQSAELSSGCPAVSPDLQWWELHLSLGMVEA